MNDSFSQISSPARSAASRGFGGNGLAVQILNLPADVGNNAKTVRLEGKITSLSTNNTARITTPSGDVDIQIKGNTAPKMGQRVELEIPPNRQEKQTRQAFIRNAPQAPSPPESAKIRATYTSPVQPGPQAVGIEDRNVFTSPVPAAPQKGQPPPTAVQQPNGQAAPAQTGTPQQNLSAPTNQIPTRTTIPPILQENLLQTASGQAIQAALPQNVTEGQVFRLLPTPPAQAQTIVNNFLQSLPSPIANNVTQAAFLATLTAQTAQDTITQPLLQIKAPGVDLSLQNQLSLQIQSTAQPLENQNIFSLTSSKISAQPLVQNAEALQISLQPPAQNFTAAQSFLQPITLTPTIPAAQALPVQAIESFLIQPAPPQNTLAVAALTPPTLDAPQPAQLLPAPITTGSSVTLPPLTAPIDVQIVQVMPPLTTITPPVVNGSTAQNIPTATTIVPPLISPNIAPSITAQVTSFTPQNLPLVTTQWPGARVPQSFILQSPTTNLQLGSQLQIIPKIVSPNVTANLTPNALRPFYSNPLLQGFQWPALDELYTSLQQLSPQAAASLSRALPNAGNPQQIAPAAMMFLAAIRSGDVGAWLGDKKMDLLQRVGKSDILSGLRQSNALSSRTPASDSSPSGDWRAVPLPMFWEGAIHKITLYTRQEGGDKRQEDKKNGQTRFVFDLNLSRMGEIQLDGLLRDNRLDLVIRAHNTFSMPMQQTMRLAYSSALESTDLTGELNFQGNPKNWVHVLENKEKLGLDA